MTHTTPRTSTSKIDRETERGRDGERASPNLLAKDRAKGRGEGRETDVT
jgi:hypothetical protein